MSCESERIAERAAEFLVRSLGETPAQRREREEWLTADPRHARVYRHLQQLDQRATGMLNDPELQALIDRDLEAWQRSRRRRRLWTCFASALLLLLVGTYVLRKLSVV